MGYYSHNAQIISAKGRNINMMPASYRQKAEIPTQCPNHIGKREPLPLSFLCPFLFHFFITFFWVSFALVSGLVCFGFASLVLVLLGSYLTFTYLCFALVEWLSGLVAMFGLGEGNYHRYSDKTYLDCAVQGWSFGIQRRLRETIMIQCKAGSS
jgi:hypothetical protein